jgi:DNA gyrase subunit B
MGVATEDLAAPDSPAFKTQEVVSSASLRRLVDALETNGFPPDRLLDSDVPVGYLVEGNAERTPVASLTALLNLVRERGRKGIAIQRYKGLGEMNPDQLFSTTMNPMTRKLLKVVLEDAIRADQIFTILMGDEVEPRRRFIEDNALNVRNLDV